MRETLSPLWLDPGEVVGLITPFWALYAIHDAVVKPMPGNLSAPSLAESWTVSPDQLVYEFKLRQGVRFHNGDPFTAEDVKFSFHRAKGAKLLQEKVRDVVIVDPHRIRFQLYEPWPDFMAFYGTLATGAAWIAPKKYVEQVGIEGFRKHPIGLGPYDSVFNGLPSAVQDIGRAWHASGWTPMGRMGTPEDIGNAVALLCSQASGWITGQLIYADGGASLVDTLMPLEIQRG